MPVLAVGDSLAGVAFAEVAVGKLYLYILFLDNFVRVDCIDHSCRFCAGVCNHFLHNFAKVDNRHLYTSPIAAVVNLWDSYNSVAHMPYFWMLVAVWKEHWRSKMVGSSHMRVGNSWVIGVVIPFGRFCP